MKYLLIKEHREQMDLILDVIPMSNVRGIYIGRNKISVRYENNEGEQCLEYLGTKVYFLLNVGVL